jgi:hypothetical protein
MVKKNEIGFRIKISKMMQLFLNVLLESEMTYFAIFSGYRWWEGPQICSTQASISGKIWGAKSLYPRNSN